MINLGVLLLAVFSGLRPGTSLVAVLALLKTSEPRRSLVFFIAAGFASSWTIGLLVVGVFDGADLALGGSTFAAVLNLALGAAALGFAAGLQTGRLEPTRRRRSSPPVPGTASRFGERLRSPSAGVAAAAGVATHLPGLVYLAALNAIAAEESGPVDVGLQVAMYDALWLLVPLASLVLVLVRPAAALSYLEDATAWARRHEHAVLVAGSFVLGGYLIVKGTASLLT